MHDIIVAGSFLIVLAGWLFTDHQHRKDKKDLLNRLMARNYHEYSNGQKSDSPGSSDNFVYKAIERAAKNRFDEIDD